MNSLRNLRSVDESVNRKKWQGPPAFSSEVTFRILRDPVVIEMATQYPKSRPAQVFDLPLQRIRRPQHGRHRRCNQRQSSQRRAPGRPDPLFA